VDILFLNDREARDFNDSKRLIRRYGPENAKRIRQRLDDLRAVANLDEMSRISGRLHPLTKNLDGWFALDLKHPDRLIIEPANDPLPVKEDGGLDWTRVTAVRVIRVGDYHG
jgi:toxin HigB-1